MKWKDSTLLQCLNKWVYSEKYGFCSCNIENIILTVSKTKSVAWNDIFIEDDNRFERFSVCHTPKDYLILFNKRVGYIKENFSDGWGGRRTTVLDEKNVNVISKVNVTLVLKITHWFQNSFADIKLKIEITKPDDVKKFDLPVKYDEEYDSSNNSYIRYPLIANLKEGDKYYLFSKGTVTIEKVLKFPSKDNRVCIVKDQEDNSISIYSSLQDKDGNKLIELPYKKIESELEIFNESINEAALTPFIVHSKENNLFNIYWQLIDDASGYIVELYKYIPALIGKKNLYHLKDYSVDRSTRYLAIENLVGTDFIFVVKAENRNGDIIARSRGIKSAYPEWF